MITKRRVIFDKNTGQVIYHVPEMDTNVEPSVITEIDFVEFEVGYKSNEFAKAKLFHINSETKEVVFDEFIPDIVTPQEQIAQLENQLLLQTNKEVGGIL